MDESATRKANAAAVRPSIGDVRSAVELATRAPSVHNTQPWRWRWADGVLELRADPARRLRHLDPDGRSLLISCGGALRLASLGLASRGWATVVDRMPDPADPDLLARIRPTGVREVSLSLLDTVAAAERRRTERRPFRSEPVPPELVDQLCATVAGERLYAHPVTSPDERLDLAVVVSWADQLLTDDDAYRAELAEWVGRGPDAPDGVPVTVIPRVPAGIPRHTDVPLRDFEVGAVGGQRLPSPIDEHPMFVVLFTLADDAEARLRVGEAYLTVSVAAERLGLATSAATQAVDLPGVRERLRTLMAWDDHPQMILRVGWPPAGPAAPLTPRRGVDDVLTVAPSAPAS